MTMEIFMVFYSYGARRVIKESMIHARIVSYLSAPNK